MHDYWLEFGKVAIAHLLAVASPGPDFAIVLKQSLAHGRRTAIWTSLGVGTAILLHVTYSLLGLGLLLRSSELWFNVVKYAGAAYIAWIGVQSLRAQPRSDITVGGALRPDSATADSAREASGRKAPPTVSDRSAFATGFFTNALNPKATLFFISLFVTIVSSQTPKLVQAGYGLWMAVATAGWFCLVSVLFTRAEVRGKFLRHGHWIDRALGVVFLGFAGWLALATLK
jgi:RhtB (resistance to homoserine/threonine) family protein